MTCDHTDKQLEVAVYPQPGTGKPFLTENHNLGLGGANSQPATSRKTIRPHYS